MQKALTQMNLQLHKWLGLSPGCRITGGKVKSSQTRQVVNRAATAFRLAAQAVSRSQTALGATKKLVKVGQPYSNR